MNVYLVSFFPLLLVLDQLGVEQLGVNGFASAASEKMLTGSDGLPCGCARGPANRHTGDSREMVDDVTTAYSDKSLRGDHDGMQEIYFYFYYSGALEALCRLSSGYARSPDCFLVCCLTIRAFRNGRSSIAVVVPDYWMSDQRPRVVASAGTRSAIDRRLSGYCSERCGINWPWA